MNDFELDELDFENETICLDCGELSNVDACQCCGGPLCYQCSECNAGFCNECLKSPDFSERMAELYAEQSS